MIILRLLLLLTNLHLKLLSTQGTGADKLLSTQRVKCIVNFVMDAFFKSSRPLTIFNFGFTNIFSMCSLYREDQGIFSLL